MTAFWLILVALTAAAVLLLVLPLLRPGRRAQTSLADANVSIYRDQFAELERDLDERHADRGPVRQRARSSSGGCWTMSMPPRPRSPGRRARDSSLQ